MYEKINAAGKEKINLRKLQIGCATINPSGWINLDGSWNAWFARHKFLLRTLAALRIVPQDKLKSQWSPDIVVHDIRKGLPFPDDDLHVIYASHVLEHLHLKDAELLLRECFRTLQPGGIIRIIVPDLYSIVLKYIEEKKTAGAGSPLGPADNLCLRLDMRSMAPLRGNIFFRLYSALKDFHSHKWMYDADSLMKYMSKAGFNNLAVRQYLESDIAGLEEVERENRIADGAGICVEGTKPQTDV